MPTFSADGQWIYFIRTIPTQGPASRPAASRARRGTTSTTPGLIRIKPDGTGTERLLTGVCQGQLGWFYWLRQPVPSPDGKTVALVSDGPNPLQSDIVLQLFGSPRRS